MGYFKGYRYEGYVFGYYNGQGKIDTIEKVEKAAIPENADIAAVEFNISGMTCAIGCAAKIEKSLNNMDGIKTATVNFEKKSATVEYDLAQINPERITNRVLENGAQFKVSGLKNISGNQSFNFQIH